jgi:hypothetical protein
MTGTADATGAEGSGHGQDEQGADQARGRPAGFAAPAASRLALTRRQRRRLGWAAAAVAVLVVVGMGGWLYARARGPAPGDFYPSQGNEHIPTAETPHVPYNSDPPTSGPHLPYIAPWGVTRGRSPRSSRCITWRTAASW